MKKNTKVLNLATIGIMTAIICVLGPLSIPIGLVPISLTNLAIFFALYALGMKKGTISCLLYILIGFVGMPVFSGFTGGAAKFFGPTGGYIIGYICMALIAGLFIDKFIKKWYMSLLGMILGTVVLYTFGTAWLAYQAELTVSAALMAGVIPFIPGDLLKIAIVTILGPKIRKALIKSDLYVGNTNYLK